MYDFYSDVKTRANRAMMEAAMTAPTGDDQSGEDPTCNLLCERVADLMGKEAALVMPSGTMCNQVAVQVHCRPGDELICEGHCHIINFEAGGAAALSGAQIRAISGNHGMFSADQLRDVLQSRGKTNQYNPRVAMVAVEQTANLGGGAVWPLRQINQVARVSSEFEVACHIDGARLLNACIAAGVSASDFAAGYDSVWLDFTKGLGCPVGAVLAGSREFIERSKIIRQRMGGGLRQAGFFAATNLYALDNNVERLADDHRRAAEIGNALGSMKMVQSVLPVETNIVIFDIDESGPKAAELLSNLKGKNLRAGEFGPRRVRIVTHLDVDDNAVKALVGGLSENLD